MNTSHSDKVLMIYARTAGLAYLLVILLGIFSVSYIDTNIVVQGDDAATLSNLLANELRFRLSVVSEIVMFVLVVLLSVALYVVLKRVDRNLALLALLMRCGEAIVGAGIAVLSGLMPLLLLGRDYALEAAQLNALVGLFLGVRGAGLDVVLIFIGVGGTLFCFLFFKARLIPRILAAWGMITYLSMLVLAVVSLLVPGIPESTKMILYAPGGLFEIVIGLWLLIKSINVARLSN